MFTTQTQIRIHYALTDQMGVVYYGNYAQFYEIGRTESIRDLGFTYKQIEAMGIFLAVTDMHIRFLRPAKYDDLITVKTTLREIPLHHKITFHGEIYNEHNELLNTGEVTLYFLDAKTMKRSAIPQELRDKLKRFFLNLKVALLKDRNYRTVVRCSNYYTTLCNDPASSSGWPF